LDNPGTRSIDASFKLYSRGMYNICLRMVGNKQDAEDILQDAFCLAYLNIKSLRSEESFGAWIKKIVINQCLKFLRSRIVFADIDLNKHDQGEEHDLDLYDFSMQEINEEIQKLPDGCRVVFNLFLLENYTHKQIAEIMEISESTSKSQYQRARQLLQKQLKKRSNG
jgi:RNA polymerase sigma factor (sigma-70 family)